MFSDPFHPTSTATSLQIDLVEDVSKTDLLSTLPQTFIRRVIRSLDASDVISVLRLPQITLQGHTLTKSCVGPPSILTLLGVSRMVFPTLQGGTSMVVPIFPSEAHLVRWRMQSLQPRVGDLLFSSHSPDHLLLDPLFFVHHANLDRCWATWQKLDRAKRMRDMSGPLVAYDYRNRRGGNVTLQTPLSMRYAGQSITVGDVMDTTAGDLCYVYDEDC